MKEKKYVWNICFNMKSGDKVETIYKTDERGSADVFDEFIEAMNKNKVVWMHMATKNEGVAVSVNLNEVESIKFYF